jgi:hypothetical protein
LALYDGTATLTTGAFTGLASIDTIGVTATDLTFAAGGALYATGTNTLALDSTGAGTVNLGTVNATTIGIGNALTVLTITSTTFNVTGTGINGTDIGQSVAGAGKFTNLVSTGNLTVGGHIISTGSAPASVVGNVAAGATFTAGSTDTAGQITTAGADTTVTVTFHTAFANAPQVVISAGNHAAAVAVAAAATGVQVTSTTGGFVITYAAAGPCIWNYTVIGH